MNRRVFSRSLAASFCSSVSMSGQTKDLGVVTGPTAAGSNPASGSAARRVALIVGSNAYRQAPPLRNAVNDAVDISNALRSFISTLCGW